MNKKQRVYERIEKHGNDLLRVFPAATEKDPIKLCKKLFRLENKAHGLTTLICNGEIAEEIADQEIEKILTSVRAILGPKGPRIFINRDARGYALKIEDGTAAGIYRDWGSYGIIAPDFREEN